MIALRGWAWLTLSMSQRFLREGVVLRSLIFPVALSVTVLAGTVAAVSWRQSDTVAITPSMNTAAFVTAVTRVGGRIQVTDNPARWVEDGDATLGTDGSTLWIGDSGHPPQALDAAVREQIGAIWRPYDTKAARSDRTSRNGAPTHVAQFIGALFAMYGVVFGAGAITRDRDDGTLDAELSVALPMWVNGLARWSAATLVLGVYFAMSVALLHAVIGVEAPVRLAIAGATAASTAAAAGMVAVGWAGRQRGFAGPMSAGLVFVVALLSYGFAAPEFGAHVPIASMFVRANGVAPLVALALGPLCALWFARQVVRG